MEDLTKHYLISGRVQGVGYRAFTRKQAEELMLGGWVRNLQDGRVEVLARGPKATLEELERRLKKGPAHGQVDTLTVKETVSDDCPVRFEVRKDGLRPCED